MELLQEFASDKNATFWRSHKPTGYPSMPPTGVSTDASHRRVISTEVGRSHRPAQWRDPQLRLPTTDVSSQPKAKPKWRDPHLPLPLPRNHAARVGSSRPSVHCPHAMYRRPTPKSNVLRTFAEIGGRGVSASGSSQNAFRLVSSLKFIVKARGNAP